MRMLIALALTGLQPQPAQMDADPARQFAHEYLSPELWVEMADKNIPTLIDTCVAAKRIPASRAAKVTESYRAYVADVGDGLKAIEPQVADLFRAQFSRVEMSEVSGFFGTPAGRQAIKLTIAGLAARMTSAAACGVDQPAPDFEKMAAENMAAMSDEDRAHFRTFALSPAGVKFRLVFPATTPQVGVILQPLAQAAAKRSGIAEVFND